MTHNYEPALLFQLNRNNELLALQCELLIASMDDDVRAVDMRHRLDRIMEQGQFVARDGFAELRGHSERSKA